MDRRPPRAEFQHKQGECDRPNFPSTTKTRSPGSSTSLSLPHPHITMSFAGRRRGNKVKKGVQFTVMVVGKPLRLQMPASAANARAWLRSARVYALQYRVLHIY